MGGGQERPRSLSVVTVGLQSLMVTLSTSAHCWPGPSKSTRPTNSSFKQMEGKDCQLRAGSYRVPILDCHPHLEWPVPCPKKNLLHGPALAAAAAAAAWGLPHQLPEAILHHNQCQEAWPREFIWVGHPQTLSTTQGGPGGWAWGQEACSTLGMTVKTVSHVEFTARA